MVDDNNTQWSAAICYNARSIARLLRETLEELRIKFERLKATKLYSQFIIVVPLPRCAYVYRFKIGDAKDELIIDVYDINLTHTAVLHFIEATNISNTNFKLLQLILKSLAQKLPRKPWQFFWSERLRAGILLPEYLKAKRQWQKIGIS